MKWPGEIPAIFVFVIRGLDPRIHHASQRVVSKWMDCRVKPGNDDGGVFIRDGSALVAIEFGDV
jgi:hypothetical protein